MPESKQEYGMLKTLQEDRMHAAAAETCVSKCISSFYMNTLLPHERSCLENCFSKHAQTDIIINFNTMLFEKQAQAAKASQAAQKR